MEKDEGRGDYEVVQTFEPPLHEWKTNDGVISGQLRARVIKRKDKVFLDIREYLKSTYKHGYTSRGLRLSHHEVSKLLKLLPRAL